MAVGHCVFAKVAELVDALDLGSSGVTRESSSLSFRTILYFSWLLNDLTSGGNIKSCEAF